MGVTLNSDDFNELKNYAGPDRVVTSFELQDILSHTFEPELRVKAKIPSLDKHLEGFEGGELIALSGPRKSGKTLLAQTLTVNFLPIKSLWFSYELTLKQFLRAFQDLPEFTSPLKLEIQDLLWMEKRIKEAIKLKDVKISRVGEDIMVEGYIDRKSPIANR